MSEELLSIFGLTGDQISNRRRISKAHADAVHGFQLRCHGLGIAGDWYTSVLQEAQGYIDLGCNACESTIERIMVAPLVLADWHGFYSVPAPVFMPDSDTLVPVGDIIIVPQMRFGRFRADFAILARHNERTKWFFVECDGRDYHMDQAKDQRRDDYLKALGVTLIRLTGRDISSSSMGAVQRVIFVVTAWKADQ